MKRWELKRINLKINNWEQDSSNMFRSNNKENWSMKNTVDKELVILKVENTLASTSWLPLTIRSKFSKMGWLIGEFNSLINKLSLTNLGTKSWNLTFETLENNTVNHIRWVSREQKDKSERQMKRGFLIPWHYS